MARPPLECEQCSPLRRHLLKGCIVPKNFIEENDSEDQSGSTLNDFKTVGQKYRVSDAHQDVIGRCGSHLNTDSLADDESDGLGLRDSRSNSSCAVSLTNVMCISCAVLCKQIGSRDERCGVLKCAVGALNPAELMAQTSMGA